MIDSMSFINWVVLVAAGALFPLGQMTAQGDMQKIRVELFLAGDQRSDAEEIRDQFRSSSIENIHFQFFRAGRPPANIAIGREVPAAIARLALKIAIQYNQGVRFLLPQVLLPPTWIGIGTSAFDESSQISVSPEAIEKLSDPSLNTEQFHALYGEFTQKQG
jgi:hypothetical protein